MNYEFIKDHLECDPTRRRNSDPPEKKIRPGRISNQGHMRGT